MPLEPSIPKELVKAIQAGRCVAFVGSGFSGAAGFPTWASLLRDLAARPEAEKIRPQIEARLKDKTSQGKDYSGFDRLLEAINDLTNPVMRYRSLLAGKRLLWVDPRWEMNLRRTALYFDMREGHEVLDLVRSAEEALERLAAVAENERAYDLVVCFWGDESGQESPQPQAVALLGEMRSRGIGVPVIVFAEREVFQKRKRQALELGALGCYYRWESLLRAIRMALDPESETA